MTARLLDGQALAARMQHELTPDVAAFTADFQAGESSLRSRRYDQNENATAGARKNTNSATISRAR